MKIIDVRDFDDGAGEDTKISFDNSGDYLFVCKDSELELRSDDGEERILATRGHVDNFVKAVQLAAKIIKGE